jgi:hypothetical protein
MNAALFCILISISWVNETESVRVTEGGSSSENDTDILKRVNSLIPSWQIPRSVFDQIRQAVDDAPINPRTGRRFITFSVANAGHIRFALNLLCTFKIVKFPMSHHFMISLDDILHGNVSKLGWRSILLPSNFTGRAVTLKKKVSYCSIIKVKPVIAYLLLLMDVEPIIIDTDVAVLESDFLEQFTDAADVECQCDSNLAAKIPSDVKPPFWQVNMGFVKFHPTRPVMKFMPRWLNESFRRLRITEQRVFQDMLIRKRRSWINSDTFRIKRSGMTIRYLDPVLISNCGLLYRNGTDIVKEEALRRGIWRPKLVHCFHVSLIREKIALMKHVGLYYEKNRGCLLEQKPRCVHWDVWHGPVTKKVGEEVPDVSEEEEIGTEEPVEQGQTGESSYTVQES